MTIADRLLELAHRSMRRDRSAVLDEALRLMIDTIERDLAVVGDTVHARGWPSI